MKLNYVRLLAVAVLANLLSFTAYGQENSLKGRVIDEEGNNVSAGEKQLITIARAFVANPSLLILDEATSSVDTRTELLVQKAMSALRTDRTSFVIAHRLSTIRDADTILVMENGKIVEQGNHQELLAAEGAYYRLYMSQFAGGRSEEAPVDGSTAVRS